ncbi:hypothetical protein QBC42DRAFT_54010 [Cladorrhinum samala]|uniref:Zn(2)-C6 fungal-type domain-containing protein n=1 Tax=Cladorrhinum samala TaxID=585594 RepID=A0AAV9HX36_9PEZI|nr:hypothetical protein QBC42DRAFT_54010 [Cladorrhinum samala]
MSSRVAAISESAAAPEARSHSPWKRSACDRCRSQKLRCTRKKEDDTSTPCTRCLRIRFPCFTSPAKPPGRLAHRRPVISDAPLCGERYRQPGLAGTAGHQGMPLALAGQASSDIGPIYVPWSYYPDDGRSNMIEDDILALSWPAEQYSIDPCSFAGDNGSLLYDTTHPFNNPTTAPVDPRVSALSIPRYTSPPPPGMEALGFDNMHVQANTVHHHPHVSDLPHSFNPPCMLDPGVLLAGLQQGLSKQLYAIKASPQNPSVLNTTSRDLTEDNYGFNPLASVLKSTSELLAISHIFTAPEDLGGSPPPPASLSDYEPTPHMSTEDSSIHGSQWPSPASNPVQYQPQQVFNQYSSGSSAASSPASTALDPALLAPHADFSGQQVLGSTYLLTLVSCYLQLISIYDAIFAGILVEVSTSHRSAYAMNLQRARAIAQTVDRRLDTVEQTLGLPREYCISSAASNGARATQGLLAGREARAVLGIMLGSAGIMGSELPGRPTEEGMFEDRVVMDQHGGFGGMNAGQAQTGPGSQGGDVVVSLRQRMNDLLRS